jgi:hypothetical protein
MWLHCQAVVRPLIENKGLTTDYFPFQCCPKRPF